MGLSLLALLILTSPAGASHPSAAQMLASRSESHHTIEPSALKRFGLLEPEDPLGIVRVAQWVDSLPLRLHVQDGGLTLAVRVRGF